MKYCFYYDESEHSRVINLSTVTGETYYDGFLAAIIGWRSDHETAFEQRYHAFEEKYADRKKKGELKSGTIKPKQLVHGLASLNEANVKLLGDFFPSLMRTAISICSVQAKSNTLSPRFSKAIAIASSLIWTLHATQ